MSMFVKVTVFVSPARIVSIVLWRTIGVGVFWIVSVTTTAVSWKSPGVLDRDLEREVGGGGDLVVARRSTRAEPLTVGSAVTETSALPWLPLGEPPVAAPCTRRQTSVIACVLARSGFEKIVEPGTPPMSVMPWCLELAAASAP